MTEAEKDRERKFKADVAEELRSVDLARYRHALDDTDKRMTQYVLSVIGHPDAHNLYELLGIRRFFRMLDKYEWRKGRVKRFIRFYEALRFNGTSGRTRYKLTPIQTFQFANIFGFVDALGRRLIRTCSSMV